MMGRGKKWASMWANKQRLGFQLAVAAVGLLVSEQCAQADDFFIDFNDALPNSPLATYERDGAAFFGVGNIGATFSNVAIDTVNDAPSPLIRLSAFSANDSTSGLHVQFDELVTDFSFRYRYSSAGFNGTAATLNAYGDAGLLNSFPLSSSSAAPASAFALGGQATDIRYLEVVGIAQASRAFFFDDFAFSTAPPPASNTWTGLGDGSNWYNSSNWTEGTPSATTDTSIAFGAVLIESGNASVKNLTVKGAGVLNQISAPSSLTVQGNLILEHADSPNDSTGYFLQESTGNSSLHVNGSVRVGSTNSADDLNLVFFGILSGNSATVEGAVVVNSWGVITLQDSLLTASSLTNDGVVQGNGGITGNVINNVQFTVLDPSGGTNSDEFKTMSINGDFTQGGLAHLLLAVGGDQLNPGSSLLEISGALSADGVLDVVAASNFIASAGMTFDLLNVGTLSGSFDTVTLPSLSQGLSWDTSNLYTTGVIAVVPEPSSLMLVGVAVAGLLRRRRAGANLRDTSSIQR